MQIDGSWRLGRSDSPVNRLYDWLRTGLDRTLARFLASKLGSESGKRALEAGSGTAFGSYCLSLTAKVKQSIALDHDLEALRIARRMHPELQAVVGDILQMPFRDECFHLVWNNSTIEHLPDPIDALSEMKRVAKRRGLVFSGVPFQVGPLGFQSFIKNTKAGEWIGPVFSTKKIVSMFKRVGLEPIQTKLFFFLFFIGVLAKRS